MNELLRQSKPVIILLLGCALLVAVVVWIVNDSSSAGSNHNESMLTSDETLPGPLAPTELEAYDVDITNDMNPIAVLNTTMGTIEIELFEDMMPITAGNFKKLIEEGFYDGIKFHRVIDGFMIQGGDPITKTNEVLRYGTGDPGYAIPDEHISGDLLTNVRGTLSMANSGPESGGSQFFINLVDNTNLDFDKPPVQSKHPVFGRISSGMDIVDAIGAVDTNQHNLPTEDIVIESATIR